MMKITISSQICKLEYSLSRIDITDVWVENGKGFTREYDKNAIKLRVEDMYRQDWSVKMREHPFCILEIYSYLNLSLKNILLSWIIFIETFMLLLSQ